LATAGALASIKVEESKAALISNDRLDDFFMVIISPRLKLYIHTKLKTYINE
jgi:hypothetical protein